LILYFLLIDALLITRVGVSDVGSLFG